MPTPAFSPANARALAGSIRRRLREEEKKTYWRNRLFGIPNRLIPALAAACLLIVAFGWFSLREPKAPTLPQAVSDLQSEEKMLANDLDVIRNMELLEEMETLQKLVQVVDGRQAIQ
jgi:hypothetical protein